MRFQKTVLIMVALLVVIAATCQVQARSNGPKCKREAPVEVTATMGTSSARVVVTFKQEASDVSVSFHGTDGLTVGSSQNPVSGRHFAANESVSFEVGFTPGSGYCLLVAEVTGSFKGKTSSKVASFSAGTRPERHKSAGTVETDSSGQNVQFQPATTVKYKRAGQ